jgi:hypothetical protein
LTEYRKQIAQALGAVQVTSATSYRWFGRASRSLSPEMTAAVGPEGARRYLIGLIERELYRSFYTRGTPLPSISSNPGPSTPDVRLVEALSSANCGKGGSDPGWRVTGRDPLRVAKNGLRVEVPHSDLLRAPRGLGVGTEVCVRRPKELRESSPGFYTAVGNEDLLTGPDDLEVRLYFNVTADGAPPLMAHCTRHLNQAEVPFRLKMFDHKGGYVRCDAAVLYLRAEGYANVCGALPSIVSRCARHLRDRAPAFAAPLLAGVAVGEHRARDGTSFGTVRCRLVAEGIVAAHERGARGLGARLDAVARRFAAQGLDVDAPFRAPRSMARYDL